MLGSSLFKPTVTVSTFQIVSTPSVAVFPIIYSAVAQPLVEPVVQSVVQSISQSEITQPTVELVQTMIKPVAQPLE